MTRVSRLFLNCALRLLAILLVAGIAMLMVRFSPGFDTDERDLDPGLSASTRAAHHNQRLDAGRRFLSGLLKGDFGESQALGVPVRQLIAERGPATLRILVTGCALAWTLALIWAAALAVFRSPAFAGASSLASACLLCVPTAAIAALTLNAQWPAELILAVTLLPRILQVVRGLVMQAIQHGEVLAARARGLRPLRILGWYVLPRIAGPMLAWLAATAGLALAAVVPIEVICDVPGLGQLAWKAALARDLPLLLVLTLLVAAVMQLSNSAAAMVSGTLQEARA